MLVPPISMGTGKTSNGIPKAIGVDNSPATDQIPANNIWLSMSFASKTSCIGSFIFGQGATDVEKTQHCVDHFNQILNGCYTNTLTEKIGGTLVDQCALYTLTGNKLKPETFTPGANGDLTCIDT